MLRHCSRQSVPITQIGKPNTKAISGMTTCACGTNGLNASANVVGLSDVAFSAATPISEELVDDDEAEADDDMTATVVSCLKNEGLDWYGAIMFT